MAKEKEITDEEVDEKVNDVLESSDLSSDDITTSRAVDDAANVSNESSLLLEQNMIDIKRQLATITEELGILTSINNTLTLVFLVMTIVVMFVFVLWIINRLLAPFAR